MGPYPPTAAYHSIQVSSKASYLHLQREKEVSFSLQIVLTANLKTLDLTSTTQSDATGAARVESPGASALNTEAVTEQLRLVSMQTI